MSNLGCTPVWGRVGLVKRPLTYQLLVLEMTGLQPFYLDPDVLCDLNVDKNLRLLFMK